MASRGPVHPPAPLFDPFRRGRRAVMERPEPLVPWHFRRFVVALEIVVMKLVEEVAGFNRLSVLHKQAVKFAMGKSRVEALEV